MPGDGYTTQLDLHVTQPMCVIETHYIAISMYKYYGVSIKNKSKTKLRQKCKVLESTSLEAEF